jgi:hypothetical protein
MRLFHRRRQVSTAGTPCILNQLMVTQVPEVEDFSQETRVLASTIDDLKAEWNCVVHGPCYVMSNSQHVPLTKFRLSGWASEIVSKIFQILPEHLFTGGHHRELAEVKLRIPRPRHCSPTGGSHHRFQRSPVVVLGLASQPTQHRPPPL